MSIDPSIDTGVITTRLRALSDKNELEILVVDDDELERALIGDRLERRGFKVSQAADGFEAMKMLEQQPFPVLIVDWRMPTMDGIQLTEQLRARGMLDTYVIMLTARDGHLDFERGYLAGVDDYLSKKVNDVELLARVYKAFEMLTLRRELRDARAELSAGR